jgi:hypothetical protein
MTSAEAATTSAAISTRAARLAIVAIASYQILLIALIFLRPDLAPSWHTISEWAIGPYGWIMSKCISHFGDELRGVIRDAETAAAWKPGPHWTWHTPDVRDWGYWSRNMHNRPYAAALSAIHQGHTSRDIRHRSAGAPSICSAADQPQPGWQRSMEVGAASSSCGPLAYLCLAF